MNTEFKEKLKELEEEQSKGYVLTVILIYYVLMAIVYAVIFCTVTAGLMLVFNSVIAVIFALPFITFVQSAYVVGFVALIKYFKNLI